MKKMLGMLMIFFSFSLMADEALMKTMKHYEALHQAFFDTDESRIKKSAQEFAGSLNQIKDEKLNKTLAYAKKKTQELLEASSSEDRHEKFHVISQALWVALDKEGARDNYARYFCPMVKKYWIQNVSESDKTLNPYASESMPHCGSQK